jgi:hypothetical protein
MVDASRGFDLSVGGVETLEKAGTKRLLPWFERALDGQWSERLRRPRLIVASLKPDPANPTVTREKQNVASALRRHKEYPCLEDRRRSTLVLAP